MSRTAGAVPEGDLAEILRRARTIAVVGASVEPSRPSFGIVRHLVAAGYVVHPVNPLQVGRTLHGRPILAGLSAIGEPIDIVDVFRRSDAIDGVVDDALAAGAPLLWLQLGIRNDPAVARAREAGMTVVENRCISVEHARRLG